MTYIISQHEALNGYLVQRSKKSGISRFIQWATDQDEQNHIGWVGFSVISMTAISFPLTMTAVLLNGAPFGLIIAAMVSLVLVITINLAAAATRYSIPILFLGFLIDAGVILASFFMK
jgi:hypothetical protein